MLRDDLCDNPATMPDSELRGIAGWAWQQLLKGEIFHGRDSGFRIHRLALDGLRGTPGGSDTTALFVLVIFTLPKMKGAADAAEAAAALLGAVASGDLTPTEGAHIMALIETYRRTLETTVLEARLAALEGGNE